MPSRDCSSHSAKARSGKVVQRARPSGSPADAAQGGGGAGGSEIWIADSRAGDDNLGIRARRSLRPRLLLRQLALNMAAPADTGTVRVLTCAHSSISAWPLNSPPFINAVANSQKRPRLRAHSTFWLSVGSIALVRGNSQVSGLATFRPVVEFCSEKRTKTIVLFRLLALGAWQGEVFIAGAKRQADSLSSSYRHLESGFHPVHCDIGPKFLDVRI